MATDGQNDDTRPPDPPPTGDNPAPPPTPPVPPPAEPPASNDQGSALDALTAVVNSVVQTVSAIGEKVESLGTGDTRPVKRPWTHWGSR